LPDLEILRVKDIEGLEIINEETKEVKQEMLDCFSTRASGEG
jgi:hypothetical protein